METFTLADIEGRNLVAAYQSTSLRQMKLYKNARALTDNADLIVRGTVTEVRFSDEKARAKTYYRFRADEVWSGDAAVGDSLTVVSYGGYLRGEVKQVLSGYDGDTPLTASDVVLDEGTGMPLPCEGDEYVLFLNGSSRGLYSVLGVCMGVYFIDGDGYVSRFTGKEEYDVTGRLNANYFISVAGHGLPDPGTLEELRSDVARRLAYISGEAPDAMRLEDVGRACRSRIASITNVRDSNTYKDNRDFYLSLEEETEHYYVDLFDELVAKVRELSAGAASRPSVLFLAHTPARTEAAGGDTLASDIIEAAGGVNAAYALENGGKFADITPEAAAALKPDYVFIVSTGDVEREDGGLLEDPAWQKLTAIAEGRAAVIEGSYGLDSRYSLDDCDWLTYIFGNEAMLTAVAAAHALTILHPELYSADELDADAAGIRAAVQ